MSRLLFVGKYAGDLWTPDPGEVLAWSLSQYRRGWFVMALAALVGWLGWSGSLAGLLALPVFAWAWGRAPSRRWGFAAALAYYLAAARGLIHGGAVFFADPSQLSLGIGLFVWFVPSLILALVWAACWRRGGSIVLGCLAALVIVGVPPFGLIGWTSPVTAAGALFPGWGWAGLALTAMGLALAALIGRLGLTRWALVGTLLLVGLSGVANLMVQTKAPEDGWRGWSGMDMSLQQTPQDGQSAAKVLWNGVEGAPLIRNWVLPETVGGDWTFTEDFWARQGDSLKARGRGALVGTLLPLPKGSYRNALVGIGSLEGVAYRQRVPVPLSMWRPWDPNRHVVADWFGPGVISVSGRPVAVLICYETLLVWPVLVSALQGATDMAWVANDWWARGTSIPAIQFVASRSWAALFGWAAVSAVNS